MANLDLKTKYHSLVISDRDGSIDPSQLSWYLSERCEQWAFIYHDKDADEAGELKTPHYHIVAVFPSSMRLSTPIRQLAQTLKVDPTAISNRRMYDTQLALQYLIHKNDPDKFQYERAAIHASWNWDELDAILDAESDGLNFEKVCDIVDNSTNLRQVIQKVGFSYYHLYRNVILDLWKTKN